MRSVTGTKPLQVQSADAIVESSDGIALPEEEAQTAADNAVKEAERAVQALEQDFEESMDDLYLSTPPPNYRPDPELQRGQRQAVELNEMICKQTGQNCEAAAMARRYYEENYGPM